MQNEYEIAEIINQIPFDLRVEVVVSDIIQSGYSATDIFVQPVGIFKRRFNKDIIASEVVEFNNHQQAVFVRTPREGIYDMLPQILFHNGPSKGSQALKSATSMAEDYRKRVLEEKEVRLFFSAYEIEFYKQRIANAIYEQALTNSISYKMDNVEFLSYWGLPKIFNNRQRGVLFYLFPVLHKIRGVIAYMQPIYEMILNQKIVIEKTAISEMEFDKEIPMLGEMHLSADSCLSGGCNSIYETYVIKVKDLEPRQIVDYLPNSVNIRIIEKLNEYFVPVFCETRIVVNGNSSARLSEAMSHDAPRLGYSLSL